MTAVAGSAPGAEREADFSLQDLFFSRTDGRGVIQSGNDVFCRVSGFDWSELLGAPHRIVRHPDTPRGVFWLMWQALGRGEPIGAYVKNRTRSGAFYWVFAVVLPIEGGFLSIRLKPSTPILAQVREVYGKVCAQETAGTLDPKGGAAALEAALASLGFANYTRFMAHALGQELSARDTRLGRIADADTARLLEISTALDRVAIEQRRLLGSFEALQSVPNNMRLVASRLEPSGGPVSAISENYRASANGISEKLRRFVTGRDNLCDLVAREASRALFLMGASRVVAEMREQFKGIPPVPGLDYAAESVRLCELAESGEKALRAAMAQALDHATVLSRSSHEIRRQMLGLETIRVLGRVESGRLRDAGGLGATIDQLDMFHSEIRTRLEAILKLSEEIGTAMASNLARPAA
ncbi:PAS domain-containing protein [Rhodobacter maris]|uniref:Aerotaxis receptor n=1 Tax=Rhodobacter maris TaxID=446682 RepID=A0A285SM25_9RHOB|nr:PAS domain-containing protein [Rhodobacter maris]SOC09075.1 aerotaxis receptor [Rhodobacter maris]